jgi:hypothetical protein
MVDDLEAGAVRVGGGVRLEMNGLKAIAAISRELAGRVMSEGLYAHKVLLHDTIGKWDWFTSAGGVQVVDRAVCWRERLNAPCMLCCCCCSCCATPQRPKGKNKRRVRAHSGTA